MCPFWRIRRARRKKKGILCYLFMPLISYLGLNICWMKWFSNLSIELITKKKTFKIMICKYVLFNKCAGPLLLTYVSYFLHESSESHFTSERSQMIIKLHHCWKTRKHSYVDTSDYYTTLVSSIRRCWVPPREVHPFLSCSLQSVAAAK